MADIKQIILPDGNTYNFKDTVSAWVGTQDEYDDIQNPDPTVTYFITDSTPFPIPSANAIHYDHTSSGLSASNVQDAIDETDGAIKANKDKLDAQTDTTTPLFKCVVFPNSDSIAIGANGVVGLSANDMKISTPTGYTPIALVSFYANNNDIFFRSVTAQATGTSTFAVVHNVGAAANVIFSAIILYAKTDYVKQVAG